MSPALVASDTLTAPERRRKPGRAAEREELGAREHRSLNRDGRGVGPGIIEGDGSDDEIGSVCAFTQRTLPISFAPRSKPSCSENITGQFFMIRVGVMLTSFFSAASRTSSSERSVRGVLPGSHVIR